MDIIKKIAKSMVNDIFCIREDERLIITMDKGSDRYVISEILNETRKVGGLGMAVEIPQPESACSGVNSFVPDHVNGLLENTDCWLDAGSKVWIYSEPFEKAFSGNKRLRYMIMGGIETEGLETLFCDLDVAALKKVTDLMKEKIFAGRTMRFKCGNGTDFTAKLNHNHVVASDIGDASRPGFHTPPALLNVVPEFGTAEGVFVCDAVMIDNRWTLVDNPCQISMKKGRIHSIKGDEDNVGKLKNWLQENGDENSENFAHLSIGLSPNILDIRNNVLYDERILGALNCGFGHVSPIDAPPSGQASNTHFDSITRDISIWVDDTQIMDNGRFKSEDLVEFNEILRGKETR